MNVDWDREVQRVRERLAEKRQRRGNLSSSEFEIRVDGDVRGHLTDEIAGFRIPLSLDADMIEVYGRDRDGEVLVATHLLARDEEGQLIPGVHEISRDRIGRFAFTTAASEENALCTVSIGPALRAEPAASTPNREAQPLHPALVWLPVAAVLALAVSLPFILQSRRLTAEKMSLQARLAERPAPTGVERLEASIGASALAPPVAALPPVVAVTLVPGLKRTLVPTNSVTLSATQSLAMGLGFPSAASTSGELTATIERANGEIIYKATGLTVDSSGKTKPTVRFTAPAGLLAPGAYLVRLTRSASEEVIDDYDLPIDLAKPAPARAPVLVIDNATGDVATITVAGRSTAVPPGASEISLQPGDSNLHVLTRCGVSRQSVLLGSGERRPLVLRCAIG